MNITPDPTRRSSLPWSQRPSVPAAPAPSTCVAELSLWMLATSPLRRINERGVHWISVDSSRADATEAADLASADGAATVAERRRDRRRPNPPATASSTPPASVPSHGTRPGPGFGAVPPNPVAAPPFGRSMLPAASVRLSILSPEDPSSTTSVCTEPAVSFTAMAAWPPCAVNVTVGEPGRTDWYDEAEPKPSSLASTFGPTLTVT